MPISLNHVLYVQQDATGIELVCKNNLITCRDQGAWNKNGIRHRYDYLHYISVCIFIGTYQITIQILCISSRNKIVVGQRRFTSGHRTLGGEEEQSWNQVTDFIKNINMEEDMAEDLWSFEWIDGSWLYRS